MVSSAFCFGVRGTGAGESRNRLKKFNFLGQGWPEFAGAVPFWAAGAGQGGVAAVPTGWGASGSGADSSAAVSGGGSRAAVWENRMKAGDKAAAIANTTSMAFIGGTPAIKTN